MQLDLYDMTQLSIEQAEAHADIKWKRAAYQAVINLANVRTFFTTDQVWEVLEKKGLSTHEPRALGAIMQQAKRNGVIESTGQYVQSHRRECHSRPIPVYRAAQ